jgi:hypothetical protein
MACWNVCPAGCKDFGAVTRMGGDDLDGWLGASWLYLRALRNVETPPCADCELKSAKPKTAAVEGCAESRAYLLLIRWRLTDEFLAKGSKPSFTPPAWCPLLHSVAKLVQKTDRSNRNRNGADSDAETSTGDDPAHASADYPERNYIRQYCVAHFAQCRLVVSKNLSTEAGTSSNSG